MFDVNSKWYYDIKYIAIDNFKIAIIVGVRYEVSKQSQTVIFVNKEYEAHEMI